MGTKTSSGEAGESPTFQLSRERTCLVIYMYQAFMVMKYLFVELSVTFFYQVIRIDMKLANEDVNMLAFTSEQIAAPFLLPEMVSIYCQ